MDLSPGTEISPRGDLAGDTVLVWNESALMVHIITLLGKGFVFKEFRRDFAWNVGKIRRDVHPIRWQRLL